MDEYKLTISKLTNKFCTIEVAEGERIACTATAEIWNDAVMVSGLVIENEGLLPNALSIVIAELEGRYGMDVAINLNEAAARLTAPDGVTYIIPIPNLNERLRAKEKPLLKVFTPADQCPHYKVVES